MNQNCLTTTTATIATTTAPITQSEIYYPYKIYSPSIYSYTITDNNNNIIIGSQSPNKKAEQPYIIKDIIEYVPNKVYEFVFNNNKTIKTVCDVNDTFNFEYGCYLAIAKLLYGKTHTLQGVMHQANELKEIKCYVRVVDKAIRAFHKKQKEEEKRKKEEALKKERHKKYVQKKILKKQMKKKGK